MSRGQVALELLQHAPAVDFGEVHIQRDGIGLSFASHGQCGVAAGREDDLEAVLTRHVDHQLAEREIIFDRE